MSTHEGSPGAPTGRLDRFLAYTALVLAALSVLSFFAIIIGTATGMTQKSFGTGLWPLLTALPLFGLPLAFILIISLLIITYVRKGRAGKRS